MTLTTLLPTANGSYQQLTASSGSHYEAVNSIGGAYLDSLPRKAWRYETLILSPDAIPSSVVISKVTLSVRFFSGSGAGSGELAILFGGVLYTYDSRTVEGGSTPTISHEFINSPDGTPWLRPDLDAIEFGAGAYDYDGGGYVDYVKVDVEYILPIGGDVQLIGVELL